MLRANKKVVQKKVVQGLDASLFTVVPERATPASKNVGFVKGPAVFNRCLSLCLASQSLAQEFATRTVTRVCNPRYCRQKDGTGSVRCS